MKKYLLALVLFTLVSIAVNAQLCTPFWPIGQGAGINPDSATGLPHAVVNMPYNAVLQFKIPKDTVLPVIGAVDIHDATIISVSGLTAIPASVPFTYSTNPVSGVFLGDSVGCASITGTATSTGVYPLTISLQVHIVGSPLAVPVTYNGYKVHVDPNTGIVPLNPDNFDLAQSYPNPTSGLTYIGYNTPASIMVNIRVVSLLGTVVYNESQQSRAGINMIQLDASTFTSGLYFYTITDGTHSMTKKLMVSAQ